MQSSSTAKKLKHLDREFARQVAELSIVRIDKMKLRAFEEGKALEAAIEDIS